jgi:hypothetical protein
MNFKRSSKERHHVIGSPQMGILKKDGRRHFSGH